ncbi:unnamed protein product [Rotaria socialis]|uniref:Uncharacterized protein n=1 Tax=Rotaria socialis TaxID=392032 RepID=A0A820JBG1_9BILA|nr:unnamed protein product [Rotaria socialis]CAF4489011.1 unnamed protein product [Rotaria socialis]
MKYPAFNITKSNDQRCRQIFSSPVVVVEEEVMNPLRRLFYLSVVNTVTFIIGSQIAHTWLNPMKDYKDFITKAEAEYQAHQEELREVEDYLDKKRQQRLKQIT